MTARFEFEFNPRNTTSGGWEPNQASREAAENAMKVVLPADAVVTWGVGSDDSEPTVTVEFDLDGRWTLEGLSMVVQALNNAKLYVAGWPDQSTMPTDVRYTPTAATVAAGTVGVVSISRGD